MHVGMNRLVVLDVGLERRVPHARGDEPPQFRRRFLVC